MRRDTVVGLFALTAGTAYSVMTWNLPRAAVGDVLAPLMFPGILGGLMILLGLGVLVIDRKRSLRGEAERPPEVKDPGYWKLILGTVMACAAYGLAFDALGYVLSTAPFLWTLLMLANEPGRWRQNLLLSAAFTFVLWLVFVKGFQINLPTFFQGGPI